MFEQPSSGTWLKPADHDGHLILIAKVHKIEPQFDNFKNADVDTATIDYIDLDDPNPTLIEHANNAHPGIVRKLHSATRNGRPVLGRIGKVPTDKGNPAWVLGPYTEGTDDTRAQTWWTKHMNAFGQPDPAPTTTPTPQPAAPTSTPAAAPSPAPKQETKTVTMTPEQMEKLKALGITV